VRSEKQPWKKIIFILGEYFN